MRIVDNFRIPEYFHHLKNTDASRDQKEHVVDIFGIPKYFHHLKNTDALRDQKELAMEVTSKKRRRRSGSQLSVG